MAYSDKVLEHYERPRNVGSLDSGSDDVGTGLVGAPECGDVMKLQIKVDDGGKINNTFQIVLSGTTKKLQTNVLWGFRRIS